MKIIGHRGASGLAPENTIAGFQAAQRCGADGIELDVRVTKDGIPVLCHDADMPGDNGTVLNVSGNTYKTLKEHKSDLVTLETVLESFYRKTTLFIEIKPRQQLGPIINLIKKYGMENILIGSFDFKILKAVRQQLPSMALFVNETWSGVRATRRARKLGTKVIDISHKALWPLFIKAMRRQGFELYTYSFNDPKKAKHWGELGLAGVITDYPDRFKKKTTR